MVKFEFGKNRTVVEVPEKQLPGLPLSLAPFFQEYDLAKLDLHRSAGTIIERVLQYGSRAEIRWLFQVTHASKLRIGCAAGGNMPSPSRTLLSGGWFWQSLRWSRSYSSGTQWEKELVI